MICIGSSTLQTLKGDVQDYMERINNEETSTQKKH